MLQSTCSEQLVQQSSAESWRLDGPVFFFSKKEEEENGKDRHSLAMLEHSHPRCILYTWHDDVSFILGVRFTPAVCLVQRCAVRFRVVRLSIPTCNTHPRRRRRRINTVNKRMRHLFWGILEQICACVCESGRERERERERETSTCAIEQQ